MKRWHIWSLLAFLVCLPVLFSHCNDPQMLEDSDTKAILQIIRAKNAPMSWFAGDWPLENHFYRPLPTLSFEMDSRLYGNNPSGYAWTNDLIAVACVLALFWLLAELTTAPAIAFAGAGLLSLWTAGFGELLSIICSYAALPVCMAGIYRHRFRVRNYLPAVMVMLFLAFELSTPELATSIRYFMIEWLPGRTSSIMTIFALLAMAAYGRYERARNQVLPLPEAKATDRPTATKSGAAPVPKLPWLWITISFLAAVCALASYEQAVMLPGILLAQAVTMRILRRKPNWAIHGLFWGLLIAYLVMRHYVIPSGPSRYQLQQFRSGPSALADLAGYVIPFANQLPYISIGLSESIWGLYSPTVFNGLAGLASTITTAYQARKNLPLIISGWVMSSLAFLPMAWLKQFGHYHYWPLALRTIMLIGVGKLAWDLASIAVCPPSLRAPKRLSPAPGSLPHR